MGSSTRRRRYLRTAIGLAAVLVLSVVGAGAWFYHRLDNNITTFDAGGVATERPPAPVPTTPGASVPVNILVLGSDTRDDGNNAIGGGEEGVGHSDTAMLVHVYADHKHAVGVSIPRDTLVTIPSCKLPNGTWTSPRTSQMFNSAFTVGDFPKGNPACTQNTVETLTGLRIDHTVVVDFKGAAAMTEAINGVDVCVPNDVDSHGIHLKKGMQKLSGQPAVDYLRARYGFGDNSDIGRMKRQQAFVSSMIKKVQGQGFSLPTLLPLADAATRSLTVDEGLGTAMKLVDFTRSLQDIKLSDITFVTAPWRFAGERVQLVQPDANTLWRLLREDRTLDGQSTAGTGTPAPSPTVPGPGGAAGTAGPLAPEQAAAPVLVVNGVGTSGLSNSGAEVLRARGFQNVALGKPIGGRLQTEISYDPTLKAAADQVAALFPGARAVEEPGSEAITVTLGRDFRPSPATKLDAVESGPGVSPSPAAPGDPGGSPSGAPGTAPSGTPSGVPSGVPTGIAENSRGADTDPCADLTFG
ncbi:LCP family protein required for cell wall assembly [Kitasatospora sp. MAA19]|uniref:LCP family protein n=1 Tax=Kitasatospora sp. MAA19 TaxID=3035090 RepID=UPI002475D38C|nr:LCP family protein [Kitasatospora sp. MAA19]MDH6705444.1 LCP family protein required for cell wall assembly [Kitasatospora sp. MAA19]